MFGLVGLGERRRLKALELALDSLRGSPTWLVVMQARSFEAYLAGRIKRPIVDLNGPDQAGA